MPFDSPEVIRDRFNKMAPGYARQVTDTVVDYDLAQDAARWLAGNMDVCPLRVLDLGCGPGTFSKAVAGAVPEAELTLVDFADEMLSRARVGLEGIGTGSVRFLCRDFRSLDFSPDSFDLVMSSLALHHLRDGEKEPFYRSVRSWLAPGGWFFNFDCLAEPDDLWGRFVTTRWDEVLLTLGWSRSSIDAMQEEVALEDSPLSVAEELRLLEKAGFEAAGVIFKTLMCGLVTARAPQSSSST